MRLIYIASGHVFEVSVTLIGTILDLRKNKGRRAGEAWREWVYTSVDGDGAGWDWSADWRIEANYGSRISDYWVAWQRRLLNDPKC